jgi:NADP-dependent 3-hydroxy acid dehydrogenase YdfG
MNGQVVLITGALSGIGRAAAVAFVKKGAKVAVTGRRDEAGKTLVKELRSLGSEAEFIKADVRNDDDVCGLVDKTVTQPGDAGVVLAAADHRRGLSPR